MGEQIIILVITSVLAAAGFFVTRWIQHIEDSANEQAQNVAKVIETIRLVKGKLTAIEASMVTKEQLKMVLSKQNVQLRRHNEKILTLEAEQNKTTNARRLERTREKVAQTFGNTRIPDELDDTDDE